MQCLTIYESLTFNFRHGTDPEMVGDDQARVGAGPMEPERVHLGLDQTFVDGWDFVVVVAVVVVVVVVAVDHWKVLEVVLEALVQFQAATRLFHVLGTLKDSPTD